MYNSIRQYFGKKSNKVNKKTIEKMKKLRESSLRQQ